MNDNEKIRALLEWLHAELEAALAQVQAEKSAQEALLLDWMDALSEALR